MFPIRDDNPTEMAPIVTIAIIGACVGASSLPVVGASGAISAVMGAYLVLYPRAKVRTLLVLLVFITFIEVPAWLYLAYWFLLQVAAWEFQGAGGAGGVAVWAHLGGFIAGFVLILLFKNPQLVEAKRANVKLPKHEIDYRGWW